MARHKQPREKAELKGSVKKNPQRYTKEEADVPKNSHGLGEPPSYLKADAKKAWRELEAHCLPGVITAAERFIFEIAACLLAEFRKDPVEFPASKFTHLVGALARLGMSPADRQKVQAQIPRNPQDEDPFTKFFNKAAPAAKPNRKPDA